MFFNILLSSNFSQAIWWSKVPSSTAEVLLSMCLIGCHANLSKNQWVNGLICAGFIHIFVHSALENFPKSTQLLLYKSNNHLQDVRYLDYRDSAATLIMPHHRHIRNHRSLRDVDVAAPQIASVFKVAGSEITGTQRKAHYSGTSGVSPTPRAPSDGETAHQHRERRADCSHTRCFVFSQLCRRKIDRCKIAL